MKCEKLGLCVVVKSGNREYDFPDILYEIYLGTVICLGARTCASYERIGAPPAHSAGASDARYL